MKLETFFEKFELFSEAPGAVKRMRELVLQLAIRGKLAPRDHNDEPAVVTFRKFAAAAIEAGQDGFPAHWLRVPLGSAGEWRGGGTPSKSRLDFWDGDLPWVSPKDMKVLHISDAQDHISEAAVEDSSVRMIPPGSLLMVVRGMILARAFPVALTMREVTINQDMKALLPSEPNTKEYLLVALRAFEPHVLAAIEHSSHGTCKLKSEFLNDFVIPIPPLAEQRRIVAKVDELMTLCDRLEVQIEKAKKASTALLDSAIDELLNPSTVVIAFPGARATAIDRADIGCYVVQKLVGHKTFGRVALMKHEYLAEAHVGINLDGHYLRQAAGPLDSWVYRFEEDAVREGWFTVEETKTRDGHKKIVYRKGTELDVKASAAFAALPQAQRDELDRMLALLGGKPTEEVEIIATLFAVWNDFLIDGHSPSDEDIVTGFREHWHEKKQKFTAKSLHTWLDWMRRNGLVPTGRGPRTQQHSKLDLH